MESYPLLGTITFPYILYPLTWFLANILTYSVSDGHGWSVSTDMYPFPFALQFNNLILENCSIIWKEQHKMG